MFVCMRACMLYCDAHATYSVYYIILCSQEGDMNLAVMQSFEQKQKVQCVVSVLSILQSSYRIYYQKIPL